jgi:hypothetical protein
MATVSISPAATVQLSATGAGQISLTPPSGTMWQLALAAVSTTSMVKFSRVFLYLGNSNGPITLIDSSYSGNSASSGKVGGTPLFPGQCIWATWTGADANSYATLQIYGSQISSYRSAAR